MTESLKFLFACRMSMLVLYFMSSLIKFNNNETYSFAGTREMRFIFLLVTVIKSRLRSNQKLQWMIMSNKKSKLSSIFRNLDFHGWTPTFVNDKESWFDRIVTYCMFYHLLCALLLNRLENNWQMLLHSNALSPDKLVAFAAGIINFATTLLITQGTVVDLILSATVMNNKLYQGQGHNFC